MQLKIRHRGLDASKMYANKLVDGETIRDPADANPPPKIPLMPSNFELEGYLS